MTTTNKCIKASKRREIHNEEEPSSNEDHFLRLPEELLISIFNMVADVSSLCRCSLVSKYFASVVYSVQTIAVAVPVGDRIENYRDRVEQLKQQKLVKFLKHFRDLESIYLVDTWLEKRTNSLFTNWKVKFSNDGTRIERLLTLSPTSFHRDGEPDLDLISLGIVSFDDGLKLFGSRLKEWVCLVHVLVECHSSVRRVFIADSEKHDKLFMEDEQLDGVKTLIKDKHPATYLQVHGCQVPVLRLPSSGYVMSKVWFVSISYSNESNSIDEMLSWDFKDEEKLLGEATKEILKHHKDRIKCVTRYVDFPGDHEELQAGS